MKETPIPVRQAKPPKIMLNHEVPWRIGWKLKDYCTKESKKLGRKVTQVEVITKLINSL